MIKAIKRGAVLTRSAARGLWSHGGSLDQKAVRGGIWVLGSGTVVRILAMLQTIILVRLLVPDDFGVMRVGGSVLAAMATFAATGMGAAIIQRKEVSRETLDTAWSNRHHPQHGLVPGRVFCSSLRCPLLPRPVDQSHSPIGVGAVRTGSARPGGRSGRSWTSPATEASPPESQ